MKGLSEVMEMRYNISLKNPDESDGYYVSVIDGSRTAFVMGPFKTESQCRLFAYDESEGGNHLLSNAVRQIAYEIDPKTTFACFGMAKAETAKRTGIFHSMYPNGELVAKISNRSGISGEEITAMVDARGNN